MSAAPRSAPIVTVTDAIKAYGVTQALTGVNLELFAGEVLGIVGHNGAGKSTLMRVLSGTEPLTGGHVLVTGATQTPGRATPGVRMAFQETNLAGELTVAHNALLSARRVFPRLLWRRAAHRAIETRLSEIFPSHSVRGTDYVDDLTIAERQMVEIARATIDNDLRVLILDEPTESLSRHQSDELYRYVATLAERGVAIVLISHRLQEILRASHRVAVMKDGAVVDTQPASALTEHDLFTAMGGEEVEARSDVASAFETADVVVSAPLATVDGEPTSLTAHRGEVVGLAGIAGQGQQELLGALWKSSAAISISKRRAYVPGDRQRAGVFPLWTVAGNLALSAMVGLSRLGVRSSRSETSVVSTWVDALAIRGGANAMMTGLSGGNQQKVIVARAFASNAEVILLDDPFRGVDVNTRADLYRLIRAEAEKGRTIIWYSSENSEMAHCDKVYVLRAGRLAGTLSGTQIDDGAIIALSFADTTGVLS